MAVVWQRPSQRPAPTGARAPRDGRAPRRGPSAWRRMAAAVFVFAAAVAVAGAFGAQAFASSGRLEAKIGVKGPADDAWALSTDTFAGQEARYRVSAAVPLGALIGGMCAIQCELELSGAEAPAAADVRVSVGGVDVTARMVPEDLGEVSVSGSTVSFSFNDVLACEWAEVGSLVAVEFPAPNLAGDGGARVGGSCSGRVAYQLEPGQPGGTMWPKAARNHSYTAVLRSVDAVGGDALAGGAFTVRVLSYADDPSLEGMYVCPGGRLSAEPEPIWCDGAGEALVVGLDCGEYLVEQAAAAPGHGTPPATVLEVTAALDGSTGAVASLEATASGAGNARVESADAASGAIVVTVPSPVALELPVTGLSDRRAPWAPASALAAALAGALALAWRRAAGGRAPGGAQGSGFKSRKADT